MTDEQEVQAGIGTVRAQIEQGHTDIGTLEEQIVRLQHQRDTVRRRREARPQAARGGVGGGVKRV